MREIIIIDDGPHDLNPEAWASLAAKADAANRVLIVDHKTVGDANMFRSNALLAAALMSGLVVANRNGVAIHSHEAAAAIMAGERRTKGNRVSSRPSGAAAAKRAKARRINVGKRPRSAHKNSRSGRTHGTGRRHG